MRSLGLGGNCAQIIKQDEQVANERLLQRFPNQVVAITRQFAVERIKQALVN